MNILNKILPISRCLHILQDVSKNVNVPFLIRLQDININSEISRNIHSCILKNFEKSTKEALEVNVPLVLSIRSTSFFNRLTGEDLWKGVTSVSNAGARRGRARGNRKLYAKNLNKGQYIGVGEANIVWPGLSAPVLEGGNIVRMEQKPKDEERMNNLVKIRDSMGKFKAMKLNPLERGWCGTKYPGRSIGPPDPIGEDHFDGFDSIVLESKTVKKMTGNLGQKRQMSMFVITGNKNGCAGFALAKGNTLPNTARRAKNIAGQNLIYIERCDGHTVFHDFCAEYFKTKIFVKRKPEGYGLVCHRGIKEICKLLGIKNLHAKIEGSTNIQTVTKAFFLGLLSQKTHQQLADEKQLYVSKVRAGMHPEVVAAPSNGIIRSNADIQMDEEIDFNIYTMGGKVEIERKKYVPFYQRLPSWETHLKKQVKCRNHEKIKRQLQLEYGYVRSFLTDEYPECDPSYRDKQEE